RRIPGGARSSSLSRAIGLWPTRVMLAAYSGFVRSTPLLQHVKLIANRHRGGFQLTYRGCDPSVGQVVTRVVVEPDDHDTGMMASGRDGQVMEVFEVPRIAS